MSEGSSQLTARQHAVIERIERRVPIKTIAAELGLSPTRVNQHVRAIKDIYGVNSLGELVETFRRQSGHSVDVLETQQEPPCGEVTPPFTKDALPKEHFESEAFTGENQCWDGPADFAFSDALNITVDAPWASKFEPAVVPGMLDGHHFVTARLLAMMGAAVGMMSLFVLILTSLVSLSGMLEGRWHVPEFNTAAAHEPGSAEKDNVRSGQQRRVEDQEADARSGSA